MSPPPSSSPSAGGFPAGNGSCARSFAGGWSRPACRRRTARRQAVTWRGRAGRRISPRRRRHPQPARPPLRRSPPGSTIRSDRASPPAAAAFCAAGASGGGAAGRFDGFSLAEAAMRAAMAALTSPGDFGPGLAGSLGLLRRKRRRFRAFGRPRRRGGFRSLRLARRAWPICCRGCRAAGFASGGLATGFGGAGFAGRAGACRSRAVAGAAIHAANSASRSSSRVMPAPPIR